MSTRKLALLSVAVILGIAFAGGLYACILTGLTSKSRESYANARHNSRADGATEAKVVEVAQASNVHTFVSRLPEGYKTSVGEKGVQLSAGQKQRIAIARVVLKNPTILLLDEATSALDVESECMLQEALERLMRGRTTVLVAQRLSTIRGVDSIGVVQDGRIAEQGSHGDLISRPDGAYSRLLQLQRHCV